MEKDDAVVVANNYVGLYKQIFSTFYNKNSLLLSLFNLIEFDLAEATALASQGDVGFDIFDDVVGVNIGRGAFFNQNALTIVLVNAVTHAFTLLLL